MWKISINKKKLENKIHASGINGICGHSSLFVFFFFLTKFIHMYVSIVVYISFIFMYIIFSFINKFMIYFLNINI